MTWLHALALAAALLLAPYGASCAPVAPSPDPAACAEHHRPAPPPGEVAGHCALCVAVLPDLRVAADAAPPLAAAPPTAAPRLHLQRPSALDPPPPRA